MLLHPAPSFSESLMLLLSLTPPNQIKEAVLSKRGKTEGGGGNAEYFLKITISKFCAGETLSREELKQLCVCVTSQHRSWLGPTQDIAQLEID